jgi:hypothetical protein
MNVKGRISCCTGHGNEHLPRLFPQIEEHFGIAICVNGSAHNCSRLDASAIHEGEGFVLRADLIWLKGAPQFRSPEQAPAHMPVRQSVAVNHPENFLNVVREYWLACILVVRRWLQKDVVQFHQELVYLEDIIATEILDKGSAKEQPIQRLPAWCNAFVWVITTRIISIDWLPWIAVVESPLSFHYHAQPAPQKAHQWHDVCHVKAKLCD